MSVRLSDIPAEGLSLSYRHDRRLLEPLGDGLSLPDDVDVSLRITPEDDRYFIQGDVKGRVQVECGRCLAPIEVAVTAACAIDVVPLPDEVSGEEKGALGRGELEVMFYSGPTLDLDDVVREQLLLNIPMRTLCREGCLGLCPVCGKNRNEAPCGCSEPSVVDPRLEGLRKLRG